MFEIHFSNHDNKLHRKLISYRENHSPIEELSDIFIKILSFNHIHNYTSYFTIKHCTIWYAQMAA